MPGVFQAMLTLTCLTDGTCRLEFDNNKVPTKYPDASNSDKIQNLYTRLNLTTPNIDRNTFIIPAFNEWMDKFTTWTTASNTGSTPNGPTERLVRPHISCRILIDCNPDYLHHLKDNLYYKDQGFKQIAKLTSFQSLELEIAADSPPSTRGDLRVRMWYQGPDPKRPMPTTNVVTMDTLLAFQVARLALEPTLGEAKWIGRGAGERLALRFCPKEHARRRSGGRA